ncbi:MAG: chlorophyll synthase ChlG [Pelatocladus maniniholoensis HA4357-MV3]|jgi:chlorophyll synthase|uniref:Chlorophyll synthase ChlG n=1 Tax=Pelatocladus maniniholoensis HA4357-MV3 TaxID=1117104 RepID=A0A9E3H2H8_9NOST|nr:chlorophyll synthase ChlG [Pelatocladus maniniholoensis HA4357-MV3]BAZ67925.1 chlorophyll synthase 33 kD subunit [Fischerella sp. NIES-4106]
MSESTPITSDSSTPTEKANATVDRSAKTRQLLGMKGAAPGESSIWKIRLQLMKPITWIPLMWGVICGAASSGEYTWTLENVLKAVLCMLLSGPLMAGYVQITNDYYDREIDAINEPYRPIPSGAISIPQVITQMWVLLIAGVALAFALDKWAGNEFPTITTIAIIGSFVGYIYSAPPLKLKQNGWLGSYALGASYITFPWCAGHALFGELNWKIVVLTMIYSLAGLGIGIINDFKSVEGDRQLGLQSLPVMFGVTTAAWICVAMIDVFQIAIAGYLVYIHENLYAAILSLLIIPQITFQDMYFLRDPLTNDVKYQASAQPFLVLGMLVAGLAIGHAGI